MTISVFIEKIWHYKKTILLSVLALVSFASIMSVGPSYAYLKMEGSPAVNAFSAAQSVDPAIEETFNGSTKSNVAVKVGETGYKVYVRAAIVVTWKDTAGNVLAVAPVKDTDYSMTLDVGGETSKWTLGNDGFYYYKEAVESEESNDATKGVTSPLITGCTVLKAAPSDGYSLSVEILAQTIQAQGSTGGETPKNPAMDAWNQTFS